jgi:hypothetical protein
VRKRLTIILGLVLTLTLAYGVIGSGAAFRSQLAGTQTLTVGTMELQINQPYEVQCAPILINTANSADTGNAIVEACPDANFTVVGGIKPDRLTVHVDVSGANELGKFELSGHVDATNFGPFNLQAVNGGDFVSVVNPAATFDFAAEYAWYDLSAASMGNTIYVTYTFTVSQG